MVYSGLSILTTFGILAYFSYKNSETELKSIYISFIPFFCIFFFTGDITSAAVAAISMIGTLFTVYNFFFWVNSKESVVDLEFKKEYEVLIGDEELIMDIVSLSALLVVSFSMLALSINFMKAAS